MQQLLTDRQRSLSLSISRILMAFSSIPQFYSDYTSAAAADNLYDYPMPLVVGGGNDGGGGSAMWGHESFNIFDSCGGFDVKPPDSDIGSSSDSSMMMLSSSDVAVVPGLLSDFNCDGGGAVRVENFVGDGYYRPDYSSNNYVCDFGVECSRFVSDYRPVFPTTSNGDNMGTEGKPIQAIEDSNIKIGRYSVEERKDRILRYLKKRNQRNFNKTIKYACRKTLADRRVRVRGRFARNNELTCDQEEDQMVMKKKKNNEISQQSKQLYYEDALQIQHDDDDNWLQEAMESLMYLPYIAGKYDNGANF